MKRMFMIVLLMFVFVLSACGDNNTENTVEENDAQANEVQESEEQSNDIEEKLDKADENQASEKEETFSEVGILKEQIASDRIEIETDDGVTEFKLTKEAQEDVDYVDVGDEVQFTYYEEDGEPTIGFIEKSKYYDKPRRHHEHHKHERHHRHQDHHKNCGHHKDRGHHHGPRTND